MMDIVDARKIADYIIKHGSLIDEGWKGGGIYVLPVGNRTIDLLLDTTGDFTIMTDGSNTAIDIWFGRVEVYYVDNIVLDLLVKLGISTVIDWVREGF